MWKDMEEKKKNSYDQAKKEAEFYKEKYFAAEKKYQARLDQEKGLREWEEWYRYFENYHFADWF